MLQNHLKSKLVMRKNAIVMGASSGMGREVALLLLADGWQVGVAARRADALEQLRKQYPEQVTVAVIDVTDTAAGEQLTALAERMGGMDLYFHASGIGKQNPNVDAEIELRTVGTNGMGFTRMIDAAFGYMAKHGGGHIAAITSVAGTKGLGMAPSYSATKAFQNTYLQALEQLANMRKLHITFTDIRPRLRCHRIARRRASLSHADECADHSTPDYEGGEGEKARGDTGLALSGADSPVAACAEVHLATFAHKNERLSLWKKHSR